MHEKHDGGRPHRWFLLLIPAAMLMIAKGRHRRMMGEYGWGPAMHGFGHRAPFGGARAEGDAPGELRLPPRIESILEAWHARAHRAADATEPPTA